METTRKRKPHILFQGQLVLLISFVLFVFSLSLLRNCVSAVEPVMRETQKEIRR